MSMFYLIKKDGVFLYHTLFSKHTDLVTRAIIVATIFYIFSPLDLIPDIIPFIGWIDDIAIIVLGINWVKSRVNSQRPPKHKDKEIIDDSTIPKKNLS